MAEDVTERTRAWAETMAGHGSGDFVRAHRDSHARVELSRPLLREAREEREAATLRAGAALARGAGSRAVPEAADQERTCFERDHDRIVHSTAFRRLAGKTQVVVFPTDHQRTRLTHALEVAQVATAVARGCGVNETLVDAIALGHDCGHGPGGHASEDAFDPYVPGGYHHGPWGADVVLRPLNLCAETLDGIRNHSWARPAPSTVEGEIVSWADRIAYCAHDLEDAVHAGIVDPADLPDEVATVAGRSRREQLRTFVHGLISNVSEHGEVGMSPDLAGALSGLRAFNYERIYTRPDSVAQARTVIEVLRGLVEFYIENPQRVPWEQPESGLGAADSDPAQVAVAYVAGMTDRFAFEQAEELLGWQPNRLPRGIGRGA